MKLADSIYPSHLIEFTITLCVTIVALVTIYTVHYHHDTISKRQTMVALMAGGVPAVAARCLLEESDPRDVMHCHLDSKPKQTKGIPL